MALLNFVLGLCLGSFTMVIYAREDQGSILFPPSHCDHCQKELSWCDKLPILSFLLLKGQCRYCHQRINLLYPLVELINGLFYLLPLNQKGAILIKLSFSFFLCLALLDLKHLEFSTRALLPFLLLSGLHYLAFQRQITLFPLIFLAIHFYQRAYGEKWMGNGDIWILFTLSLRSSFSFLVYLIILGLVSGLALPYLYLKKIKVLAFVPLLFTAYLLFLLVESAYPWLVF